MPVPTHWKPRYRPDDEELVGYLADDGSLVIPMTVFGSPLAGACHEEDAVALLDGEGLASLADQWRLLDDGSAADSSADGGSADGGSAHDSSAAGTPASSRTAVNGPADGGIAVAVLEADPERLVVRHVDFGSPDTYGMVQELPVPVGPRLVRDGRLSGSHQAIPARP
jgi:hypothetical protein